MPNYEEFVIPTSPDDPCEVMLGGVKWQIPKTDCIKYANSECSETITSVEEALAFLQSQLCDSEVERDVTISKEFLISDSPEVPVLSPVPHGTIVYMKVSVFSNYPFTEATVRDTIPEGLILSGPNPFPWSTGVVGTSGASIIVPLVVNNQEDSATISNTAQVTNINGEVATEVISATAELEIDNVNPCVPVINVEKTIYEVAGTPYVGQDIVVGDTVVFKITASNASQCAYPGGDTLDDLIPDIFTFQSASPTEDSYVAPTVSWELPYLAPLGSAVYLLTVTATTAATGRTNCATVKDGLANIVASDCLTGLSVLAETENIQPISNFTYEATPNETVTGCVYDITDLSQDPDGQVVKWEYNWGDGSPNTIINRTGEIQNGNTSHEYLYSDTNRTITLTVTDNEGATGFSFQEVLCADESVPPTASFQVVDCTGTGPFVISFSSTSTPGTFPISTYEWAWGDGKPNSGPAALPAPTHQFDSPGIYNVTLTVTDTQGNQDFESLNVNTSICDNPVDPDTETIILTPDPDEHLFNPWTGFSGMGRAYQASDHPLSTMFYLRGTTQYGGFTWGNFETSEGVYDFSEVGQALNDAATHPRNTPGHAEGTNSSFPYNKNVDVTDRGTINIRVLMMDCQSSAVTPQWVKDHQIADGNAHPVINGSAYIPDYEDPWYLGKRSAFLNALNNYIQGHARKDRLNFIDIGLGNSGEWHHGGGGGACGVCESQHLPSITKSKEIINQFFTVFQNPSNSRKIQLVASFGMNNVPAQANGGFELMKFCIDKGCGWRCDFYGRCAEFGRMCTMIDPGGIGASTQGCGGQPSSQVGTAAIRDAWKNYSVNLEPWNDMTRWASQDSAQVPKNCSTPCAGSSTDYLGVLRFGTNTFHANSAINMGVPYAPSASNGASQAQIDEIKGNVEDWMLELGYRLVIEEVEYPPSIGTGEDFFINVTVGNHGSAPNYTHYSDYEVHLTFDGGVSATYTEKNLGKILPGQSKTVAIPVNLASSGTSTLKVGVQTRLSSSSPLIPIHMGNSGKDSQYRYSIPGASITAST